MRFFLNKVHILYLKSLVSLNRKKLQLKVNVRDSIEELKRFIDARKEVLGNLGEARNWFEQKTKSIEFLFEYESLRQFIFEQFSELWKKGEKTEDQQIYAIITQVSIANAVLAGLPGKLGFGVFVCIALEFYMAMAIARRIGFRISSDDLWSRFRELSTYGLYFTFVGFIAVYAFKHMFGFVFTLIPGILPQTVITEYIVTTFVGILFWQAFEQTRDSSFFYKKLLKSSYRKTKELLIYQKDSIKSTFSKENLLDAGQKIRAWFTGDFIEQIPRVRGDVFVSISLGSLLQGNYQLLDGPMGKIFLKSIRDRWSELSDASPEKISEFMNNYSSDQIPGVISTIKGKFFENLVEIHENNDGDEWTARLHDDESYTDSDMIITNAVTGETIELSLKATYSGNYVESVLSRYPDTPILTTSEVSEEFQDLENVIASEFSNSEIQVITESNFEELVHNLTPFNRSSVASASVVGIALAAAVTLWPFVMAHMRKRISLEELQRACEKVFPKMGKELAYRITFTLVFGPIYGWYVLASTAMNLTPEPKKDFVPRYLEYNNPKQEK